MKTWQVAIEGSPDPTQKVNHKMYEMPSGWTKEGIMIVPWKGRREPRRIGFQDTCPPCSVKKEVGSKKKEGGEPCRTTGARGNRERRLCTKGPFKEVRLNTRGGLCIGKRT